MAKALTVKAIESIKPSTKRLEIPDGLVRGLFYVLQPSGRAAWAVRYRFKGQTRKLTLGTYPAVQLKSARELASQALLKIASGSDPAAEKRASRVVEIALASPAHPVDTVIPQFIERYAKPNTREASWSEAERILRKELGQPWSGQPISALMRADIHAILDRIVDRGSPISANRTLAVMSRFFSWCVEREIIATSPCEGVNAPAPPVSRDRVLSDRELGFVWLASAELGWPFGPLFQILILTGQRREEVAGLRWREIDLQDRIWLLPRERAKRDRANIIALGDQAVHILEGLPRIESELGLVFTTTGDTPVSGFSRARRSLDALIREIANGSDIAHWTLHDLRRTLASGCARQGVPPQVVEAILNHSSGIIRGVAAVYNRYDYANEKKAALENWGRHVANLAASSRLTQSDFVTLTSES